MRLVDLLDEACKRMEKSLQERIQENKSSLSQQDVPAAAASIGYGAVKYFDLHQHPTTNYQFSYDKMLSTQGNTAVYLLFAHARLASIVRKAESERQTNVKDLVARGQRVVIGHPSERALALELLQLSDTLLAILTDFMPSRLCDYLYNLSTLFTTFITQCKVLGSDEQDSRLLLCHATGEVMRKCFDLLGIQYLMQI